jgi:hypothetical protein
VYAALAGVFFFLVIQLQVVAAFAPITAGLAMIPMTVLMLFLSARVGALSNRVGPRILMTIGTALSTIGLVLLSRIGPDASYPLDVAPGVVLLGLGMSLTVAPLTSTVLTAATNREAGLASGVNNAVARTASLLAVAVLPVVIRLGPDLTDPANLSAAYPSAMLVCAGLMATAALISLTAIPTRYTGTARRRCPEALRRTHCAVGAPPL